MLAPGALVAVVSPCGPSDAAHIDAGVAWLRERYRVEPDARRALRAGYLAGEDASRAAAVLEAARDPAVRAVFATRGGYGAMRVLERAGDALLDALARDPKPLVGFSDVTALASVWLRAGAPVVHAPMVAAVGRGGVAREERDALLALLEGRARPAALAALAQLAPGRDAVGLAVGGNLALIAALHGTPWALPLRDAVLFLEDVGEKPYRVDRMLTTLRLGGALRAVRAVVLGDFTGCDPADDGTRVEDVLRDRLADLAVPVLAGAAFGHAPGRTGALLLGVPVRVRAAAGVVEWLEPGA